MAGTRRVIIWVVLAVGGLGLAGVGVFFVRIGLANANQWAGVLGFFATVAGLGLSGYGVLLARRPSAAPGAPPPDAPGQSVSGTVSGDNIQIGSARDVTIGRNRSAP